MFSKKIKDLWVALSVVLMATSVSAATIIPMPEYMQILGANLDDTACWEAFDNFMSSGNTDKLPMIFTTEESKVAGRSGSPMCKSRLFGFRTPTPGVMTHEEADAANAEIKGVRTEFRERLVGIAKDGDSEAQKYVKEAVGKFPGFQRSEVDVTALKDMIALWPEEEKPENKEDLLKRLVSENKFGEIKDLALELANGDSEYARRVVLEGIFETSYGGKFVPLQGKALELLEKYALLGSIKAFEIIRTMITVPPIKAIAIKPEIIQAAEVAGIDSAVGGWEGFLRAKGIIE